MIEIYLLAIPFCFLIAFFLQFSRLGFFKSVLISLMIAVTWPISLIILVFKRFFRAH